MNDDVRNALIAFSAWVFCCLVVRLVGQFVAGHTVAVWKRCQRRHRHHKRRP